MPNPADPLRPEREEEVTSQPAEPAADEEGVEEAGAEPEFLSQVMNQTLAGLTSTRELNPKLDAALLDVARQYPGESLSLDPVAIELIAASLRVQFPAIAQREPLLRRMSLWVAESVLADPAARHRLAELWARLGEAVQ
ncbi:hypothetical protein ETAA8_63050 [Anatilimnocola aggregata]|uniref:Uncharacterized protein n=1 Tax=Anatilimnocola aggregata TaxID=2528021 RepID=A0A517YLP3_9BACT|nr:hypothetical protein [Anatilimnocola aggregata]QDU31152.1 hypothetical protein ETAA8_63050 [Anatilimnocola aggregata]